MALTNDTKKASDSSDEGFGWGSPLGSNKSSPELTTQSGFGNTQTKLDFLDDDSDTNSLINIQQAPKAINSSKNLFESDEEDHFVDSKPIQNETIEDDKTSVEENHFKEDEESPFKEVEEKNSFKEVEENSNAFKDSLDTESEEIEINSQATYRDNVSAYEDHGIATNDSAGNEAINGKEFIADYEKSQEDYSFNNEIKQNHSAVEDKKLSDSNAKAKSIFELSEEDSDYNLFENKQEDEIFGDELEEELFVGKEEQKDESFVGKEEENLANDIEEENLANDKEEEIFASDKEEEVFANDKEEEVFVNDKEEEVFANDKEEEVFVNDKEESTASKEEYELTISKENEEPISNKEGKELSISKEKEELFADAEECSFSLEEKSDLFSKTIQEENSLESNRNISSILECSDDEESLSQLFCKNKEHLVQPVKNNYCTDNNINQTISELNKKSVSGNELNEAIFLNKNEMAQSSDKNIFNSESINNTLTINKSTINNESSINNESASKKDYAWLKNKSEISYKPISKYIGSNILTYYPSIQKRCSNSSITDKVLGVFLVKKLSLPSQFISNIKEESIKSKPIFNEDINITIRKDDLNKTVGGILNDKEYIANLIEVSDPLIKQIIRMKMGLSYDIENIPPSLLHLVVSLNNPEITRKFLIQNSFRINHFITFYKLKMVNIKEYLPYLYNNAYYIDALGKVAKKEEISCLQIEERSGKKDDWSFKSVFDFGISKILNVEKKRPITIESTINKTMPLQMPKEDLSNNQPTENPLSIKEKSIFDSSIKNNSSQRSSSPLINSLPQRNSLPKSDYSSQGNNSPLINNLPQRNNLAQSNNSSQINNLPLINSSSKSNSSSHINNLTERDISSQINNLPNSNNLPKSDNSSQSNSPKNIFNQTFNIQESSLENEYPKSTPVSPKITDEFSRFDSYNKSCDNFTSTNIFNSQDAFPSTTTIEDMKLDNSQIDVNTENKEGIYGNLENAKSLGEISSNNSYKKKFSKSFADIFTLNDSNTADTVDISSYADDVGENDKPMRLTDVKSSSVISSIFGIFKKKEAPPKEQENTRFTRPLKATIQIPDKQRVVEKGNYANKKTVDEDSKIPGFELNKKI